MRAMRRPYSSAGERLGTPPMTNVGFTRCGSWFVRRPSSGTAVWWDGLDPDARVGADVLGLRGDDSVGAGSELEARLTACVGAQGMAVEADGGAGHGFAGVGHG